MNPLITLRIPVELKDIIEPRMKSEGYTNLQELIKSLLREYALEKKRLELQSLWGSQSSIKPKSKAEMLKFVEKEYFEKI